MQRQPRQLDKLISAKWAAMTRIYGLAIQTTFQNDEGLSRRCDQQH